jgi:acetyl esterase
MALPKPPGQLGDPSINISNDPRTNAAMLQGLAPLGLGGKTPSSPLTRTSPYSELLDFLKVSHDGFQKIYDLMDLFTLPDDDEKRRVTVETKTIPGGDGQDMKLIITRPEGEKSKELPGVIYYHGGGMTIIPTDNPLHRLWCRDIATSSDGAIVIMPDFRNAYDDVNHTIRPFPAGLNDCVAAAKWIHAHKQELGINTIVAEGESGGANLAIATAMKLIRDGKKDTINGVYGLCPYISGMYDSSHEKLAAELPSLLEFDGYFLSLGTTDIIAWGYDPEGKYRIDPLAWPYHISDGELASLPPMTIVVDELDPLSDEGRRFAQRAIKAGVNCVAKMNLGTVHHGSGLLRRELKGIRFSNCADIVRFARSL